MSSYLVDGADLTSVANAIRTKGGTSGQLAFPAGFVSAVQAIPTGGSPTGTKQISITANGTTTEDVAAYANAEITVNVSGGGGGSIPLPAGCTLLDYVDAPGSCLFDTGKYFTYPSTGYAYYIKFGIHDKTSTQMVAFGSFSVSGGADQLVLASGRIRLDRTGYTNRFAINVGDVITYIDSYTNATNGGGTCYAFNENTQASVAAAGKSTLRDITPTDTAKLFGAPTGGATGGVSTPANVRFYEMFYKEGTSEIIHLYPILDSNGTYCLYDTVGESIMYPTFGAFVYNGA